MKHLLLTIIAAVLVVGCGPGVNIHEAARTGNIEAVKQHIAAGTDVNAKDKYGETPLHNAAHGGHKEIAELLIAKGADVNTKIEDGETPLHWTETEEIAELLIAADADVNTKIDKIGMTPLHIATGQGYKEIVELLIAKGADVNAKVEITELLIANGADVNAKDVGGKTPLDWAIRRHHHEIADLLRKHGGKTGEELKAEGK